MVTNKNILFLIIGEGKKRKKLEQHIASRKLKNCFLLPWQEVAMLPYSMAAADLAVVTLGKEASLLSVPSKTYNFISAGVPLLCIADERSELFGIVRDNQCGACFNGEDPEALKNFIESLAQNGDQLKRLNEKSLTASKKFDPENAFNLVAQQRNDAIV
jgi:glycosyltransferase involved in cell wall biosynthesis